MTCKIPYHMMISVLDLAPRDRVFRAVLNPLTLQYTPLNILQVGAIEKLDLAFKYGSGWSDITFASYNSLFGGELTIVDINKDHLENSKKVLSGFNASHTLVEGDARDLIEENSSSFDLVYLDGSNDPAETKEQYDLIDKDATSIILIDDYSLKGKTIVHDERYSGQILGVTDLGFYVGINHTAMQKITEKIKNPEQKVMDDLSVETFV